MTKKRVNRQPKALRESVKREQRRQAMAALHRRSSWGRSSPAASEADELSALFSADADYPYDPEEEDDWPGAWPGQWPDGWWGGWWDDDEDPPFTDAQALTAERLEMVVTAVLHEKTLAPAEAFMATGEAGPIGEPTQSPDEAAWSVLSQWLITARQTGLNSPGVITWTDEHLPKADSLAVWQASGLIGFVSAPPLLIGEMMQKLDARFIPALIGLAAGIAAVPGEGDAHYLREFDPGHLGWC
jgi:hypothetical protein